MKKISLLSLSLLSAFTMNAQNCSELFISEYVEGWSNNKAIELYNPTSETIDLSNYALSRWSNGASVPLRTVLEGSIGSNQAFVIGLDKRDPDGEGFEAPLWDGWYHFTDSVTLLADSIYTEESDLMSKIDLFICPNYEDGTMYFNGNDAFTLETSNGDILDVIGKIGENPGEAWADETGAYWTKDQTLVRKSEVTSPFVYDPNSEYTFDPTLEWDSLPANSFSGLGSHECDCALISIEENHNSIQMYPNPNTTGQLTINASTKIQSISIYNVLGEKVLSKNYNNSSITERILLSPKLKGLYFVEVLLENKEVLLKKLLLN
jgi:hypothetical protein